MRCKPRNKRTYGFESCGLEKPIRQYGLCDDCFKLWLKTDKGQEYIESMVIPKAKKEVKKREGEKFKKMKSECTNFRPLFQKEINRIVRYIDHEQPCTALGTSDGQMHGGHVNSSGGHKQCTYNLHNIHIQCAQSNNWRNDDGKMQEGVERIYGKKYRDFVNSLLLANINDYKHSNIEYEELYHKAREIANGLSKTLKKHDTLERIMLRNKYNKEIGCYPDSLALFDTLENQKF